MKQSVVIEPSRDEPSVKQMSSVSTSTHFLQGKMLQTDGFEDPR